MAKLTFDTAVEIAMTTGVPHRPARKKVLGDGWIIGNQSPL
jgi:hypothetical protein